MSSSANFLRPSSTILILSLFFTSALVHGAASNTKHYIVYMGENSNPNSQSTITAHHQMLAAVTGSMDEAQRATVHHYTKSFGGFSAMLTPEQARAFAERHSTVHVFESRMSKVHTTRSWEFLGIEANSQSYNQTQVMKKQSNVIVGVIDTGIWPESESFNDEGLGSTPWKFKGECMTGERFAVTNCNKKIVGARFYSQGFEAENGPLESFNQPFFRSPRDADGHGTHTASTIAGSVVANVSLFGLARGTATGGVPAARLAIYKACWFDECSDADVLAAFDDAIRDGVDIISVSLGGDPKPYFEDAIAVGSFHAFRSGILVSASAGNAFLPGSVTNAAPWILTVAASSLDRKFDTDIYLGNSKVITGISLNRLKMETSEGLIAASAAAAPGVPAKNASFCRNNTLDASLIKGKIVICTFEAVTDERREKVAAVIEAGGIGIIVVMEAFKDIGFQFPIPGAIVGQDEGIELQQYVQTEKYPVARIEPTVTILNTKPAPEVTAFSSRGPSVVNPEIIKPDITGPGLNILAAWSPVATELTAGKSVNYNIISGTSMSCPHVSAVAAIIKSLHPSWSPAAIKSAMMTTGATLGNTRELIKRQPDGEEATPFDYGSGHINPRAAVNPGLVYDFDSNDVVHFLCSKGASPAQLRNLTGSLIRCDKTKLPFYNFNYPSIGVSDLRGNLSVYRTVTYYGNGPTAYQAYVFPLTGVRVAVSPSQLAFTKTGEKLSFRVDLSPYEKSEGGFVFGALSWRNDVHKVTSPIGVNIVSV